jgi:hypothetical protein
METRIQARVGAVLVGLLLQYGGSAAAQVVIPDRPSCAACSIEVENVVRLDPAALLPTSPASVVRDSGGRYWVTFPNDQAMVFASDGGLLLTLREGGGPGEFRYPAMVVPVGDSVVVFDRGAGPSVMGPDHRVARRLQPSRILGRAYPIVWPDSVLINTGALARSGNRSPFHVASLAGPSIEVVRSFGEEPPPPAGAPRSAVRAIAPSRDGGLWAAPYQQYEIELWSLAGELQQTLVRRPSWFPEEPRRMNFSEPPPPRIRTLEQDAAGRLWVYVNVAASTWQEGYPRGGGAEVSAGEFSYEKLYDTTVEVLDPIGGRVLARRTLDRFIVSALPDGHAAIYDTTEAGEPFVEIVRLSIGGLPPEQHR